MSQHRSHNYPWYVEQAYARYAQEQARGVIEVTEEVVDYKELWELAQAEAALYRAALKQEREWFGRLETRNEELRAELEQARALLGEIAPHLRALPDLFPDDLITRTDAALAAAPGGETAAQPQAGQDAG